MMQSNTKMRGLEVQRVRTDAQSSFQGDMAVRSLVVARLQTDALPEYLSGGPIAFGEETSPAGAMVQGNDASAFPAELGLPRWLAFAIDEVFGGSTRQTVSARLGAAVANWPLGVDLGSIACRVVARAIVEAQDALSARGDGSLAELNALADQVCALHLDDADLGVGQDAPDPWRALRRAIRRLVDTHPLRHARLLGACVEAAAWGDLASSDTTVADVLRALRSLRFTLMDESLGWTEEVQEHIEALHVALEKELEQRDDASADLFQKLFRERHPEAAQTLSQYYRGRQERVDAFSTKDQDVLLGALLAG